MLLNFFSVIKITALNVVLSLPLSGFKIFDLLYHTFSNDRTSTVTTYDQVKLMSTWIIATFRCNCSIMTVYIDDFASLMNLHVGCTNVNSLVKSPHDFQMRGHKRWTFFFTWNKFSIDVGHAIVFIEMVLENRHAPEPVNNLQAFATNIHWVHQRPVQGALILFVFVIVKRLFKDRHVMPQTTQTNCS